MSSIIRDKSGILWFGTEQGGLCRAIEEDGQRMKFISYSEEDGLSNNVVKSLLLSLIHICKGRLIVVSTLNEMKNKALAAVKSNKGMPAISIAETNDRNMPGCEWRVIAKDKNRYIVNIVNIGKSDATVRPVSYTHLLMPAHL